MKIRRLALAASLAALAVSAWAADNVTGKWMGEMSTGSTTLKMTLDLKADKMKLTGSLMTDQNPQATPISDGNVEGDDVSFKVSLGGGPGGAGGGTMLVYKGMVKGDELTLTRTFEGTPMQGSNPEVKFMLKREKDAAK